MILNADDIITRSPANKEAWQVAGENFSASQKIGACPQKWADLRGKIKQTQNRYEQLKREVANSARGDKNEHAQSPNSNAYRTRRSRFQSWTSRTITSKLGRCLAKKTSKTLMQLLLLWERFLIYQTLSITTKPKGCCGVSEEKKR